MKLIDRADYLEKLKLWQDQTDLLKIITGVRRCGKSKLLELFQAYLGSMGVADDQITSINLEDDIQSKKIGLRLNKSSKLLDNYELLLDFIVGNLARGKKNYVFLDEIQLLDNWQQLANTLRLQANADVSHRLKRIYVFRRSRQYLWRQIYRNQNAAPVVQRVCSGNRRKYI